MSRIRTVSETEQPKVGDFLVAVDWLYTTAPSNPIGYGVVAAVRDRMDGSSIDVFFKHSPEKYLAVTKYRKCPKLEQQSAEAIMGVAYNFQEWSALFADVNYASTILHWYREGIFSHTVAALVREKYNELDFTTS